MGRFLVLETLGQGGMGIVVAAYDPDLDRKVALKLLNPQAWEHSPAEPARARLIREARAMARLSHPHVVTIHEVGNFGEQVFLAMEFAAGGTLRGWQRAERRPWREIVAKFAQAGRGLSAAHRAGLVHRDFKPENALLSADGHVRVADFGVVGVGAREGDPSSLEGAPLNTTLTSPGRLLGTPAYMAPEQHRQRRVGPEADQFSFCVALWEALYGEAPFAGASYREFSANVIEGNLTEPPAGSAVPPRLRRVLERGLRPEPEERWPSMEALVEALERDPGAERRRRVRRIGVAAALLALSAIAIAGLFRSTTAGETPCRDMGAKLSGVWDEERRADVHEAFAASGRAHAEDTTARVSARLDAYARDWVAARREACEATRVRGTQSEALLDRRIACLDRRLDELEALVDVFAERPGAGVIDRAAEAASELPPLGACADTEALQTATSLPADPEARAQVARLREKLSEARALERTGQYREGLPVAASAAERARDLDHPPALAEALFARATLEEKSGDAAAAEATLEEALLFAAEAGDEALAVEIWAHLLLTVGNRLGRPDEALALRPGAEAALRRAGGNPGAEASLRLKLGAVFATRGDYREAAEHLERALAILEEELGPEHPRVAASLNNLANVLMGRGHYREARRHHERALAIRREALGSDHPDVAASLNNLGQVLYHLRRYEEAGRRFERALALWEEALGSDHPDLALSLVNLGRVASKRGAYEEARRRYERALALREEELGAEHPQTAVPLYDLGVALEEQGRHEEARLHFERSLARFENLGPDHPNVAYALTGLAESLLSLGRHERARAAAERAVRIREAAGVRPKELAESRFALARSLWPRERRRALDLAREARTAAAEAGEAAQETLAEIEAWRAGRDGDPRARD